MKKIVGILAAAALAASVFAVDFTAGMQLKGELFKYDGATKAISAMTLNHDNGKDDKPFVFSLNTDRVGGQLKVFHTGSAAVESAAWQIWFKPFDVLKVDLGNFGWSMNTETITYWKGKVAGTTDWGWRATANFSGFELGAGVFAGNNTAWLSVPNGGQATVGETAVWAQYSADFGTIKALGIFENTFKKDTFAVGYNNKFGDLSIFADAAIILNTATNVTGLNADFDIAYAKDAISVQLYAATKIGSFNNVNGMTVPLFFKAAYALNGGSLYFKFLDDDIKANSFAAEFHVGYDGNLGAMAYEVEALINVAGNNVTFSVPVWFRLSF